MSAKFPRGGGGSKPILSHPSSRPTILVVEFLFDACVVAPQNAPYTICVFGHVSQTSKQNLSIVAYNFVSKE